MRLPQAQRDRQLSRFFILLLLIAVTACQTAPAVTETAAPPPTETPVPPPTPAGPPGILWVDTTKDLGQLSPYTLGGNHGPWSDFSLDASGNVDLGQSGAGVITEQSHRCYFTGKALVPSGTVKAKG